METSEYIGTYYVSPPNSKHSKNSRTVDFFSQINDEITLFKRKGVVLVQGDLNARIGHENYFIVQGKFDQKLGIENLGNQRMRNSQDQITNTRGKELLNVCKLNNFLIMNGRKIGDVFGSLTSHQWNGSSVVDYFLSPNTFAHNILNFSVGKYIPWISDHCPIHTNILMKCGGQGGNQTPKSDPRNIQSGYIETTN